MHATSLGVRAVSARAFARASTGARRVAPSPARPAATARVVSPCAFPSSSSRRVRLDRVVRASSAAASRVSIETADDDDDDAVDDVDASGSWDEVTTSLKMSHDARDIVSPWPRKPLSKMGPFEKFEYVFVRVTLIAASVFALLGVVASLILSGLLFAMGMKEVLYEAVHAFVSNNPVELVSSAVGALDRFLLGMVCLVFGLGSFELFLARSNREGEVRDRRLKKLSWLRVSSIDDLEQKVGEIIVAVMVVNLLEMSLHMKYGAPMDLVWAALAALFSAGALALLHWSSMKHNGGHGPAH